jgi:hypothetical protein
MVALGGIHSKKCNCPKHETIQTGDQIVAKLAWWQSMPSWLIIVLCCSVGVLYAFVVTRETIFPEQSAPTPLPPLPAVGVAISGIETPHFFQANPYIQAADGQIYSLIWEQGAYNWQIKASPSTATAGDLCSPANVRLIEATASPVIDCRVVRTVGEWCPGTIVSFAVTDEGDVWELVETPTCLFFFGTLITLFVPAGFVLGVIIVVVRQITRTRFKFKKR